MSSNNPASTPPSPLQRLFSHSSLIPGAALSGVIALAATFLATLHGGPQFLYALFLGIAFNYLSQDPATRPGVEFCARTVLRFGVGLLGASLLDPEQRHKRGLARIRVLAHGLADGCCIPFRIEQVVGDLECNADVMPIGAERGGLRPRLAPQAGRVQCSSHSNSRPFSPSPP